MWIYEITIRQSLNRDGGWKREDFVERVNSMQAVIFTISRFRDCDTEAESDFRRISTITIKRLWLKVE